MISTAAPEVASITSTKPTGSGPYGVGEEIDVTVLFTKPVEVLENVTNAPRLRYGALHTILRSLLLSG